MKKQWHTLLRGGEGKREHKHRLFSAEMKTLASICETVLPPISIQENETPPSKPVQDFFAASGFQATLPDEVKTKPC